MSTPETGYFKGEGGVVWEMALPLPEQQAEKVTKGYLVRCDAEGGPWIDPSADKPAADAVPELPDARAGKPVWVGWVVKHLGVKPDDAEAKTKHDLMDDARRWHAARTTGGQ